MVRSRVGIIARRIVGRRPPIVLGRYRSSGCCAQCPADNRTVPPSHLVAYEGAQSAADGTTDGRIQTIVIRHRRYADQAREGQGSSEKSLHWIRSP